ncbi:methyl-accepting chemotaxis protein 4 [mine drainage metagenome]|uniref:Methyl-accepting chemotaxis protein 4 n=1 Tax=mine drainage metagenome TaxID=410659 RepID=A0A1J5PU78_9ZZZZ
MHKLKMFVVLALAQACLMGTALAQVHGTAEEAKTMATNAIAHIKAVGPEKAFADFTARGGKWQDKDLYVFVVKYDGMTVAHGANQLLVGKNLIEMKDAGGKAFIQEMINIAKSKGSGWADYLWTNPITKKTDQKSTYVIAIPGYDGFVGVGIYK